MRRVMSGVLAAIGSLASASAAIDFSFQINSSGTSAPYHDDVVAAITAAGEQWTQYLPQSGDLEIQITFIDGTSPVSGRSASLASTGADGGFDIFQPGAEYELNGFGDPNGDAADIQFTIGTDILSQMWFDPDPSTRNAVVPGGSFDAISLFMPGFGRAFGYFSYLQEDGTPSPTGTAKSSFDLNVSSVGGNPFFNGANAMALFGGPVPLANGPVYLLDDQFEGDVMSNAGIAEGERYFVSALDLAILSDSGLETLPIPEPHTLALLALFGAGLCWRMRALRR